MGGIRFEQISHNHAADSADTAQNNIFRVFLHTRYMYAILMNGATAQFDRHKR